MAKKGKFIDLLKALFSGLIGAGIFFLFGIFAIAIVKMIYILMSRDLVLSRYNVLFTLLLFIFFGFAYGMSSYVRKNIYRKMIKLNWINVLMTVILTAIVIIGTYLFIKYKYRLVLGSKSLMLMSIILLACFYLFCAILTNYLLPKRKRVKGHHARNALILVIFNPFFVLLYIWLFLTVAYNSVYAPCGVQIVSVEQNIYTSNTHNLGIESGEKIISIDGVQIQSVQDVKRYMNALSSTKQVVLETNRQLYYVRTYSVDDKRYMGLLLRQEYCVQN